MFPISSVIAILFCVPQPQKSPFFIQDRQEDGSCVTLLNETVSYTEEEGFFYIEGEAIEFYIEGRILTWRVDFETTIVFEKNG